MERVYNEVRKAASKYHIDKILLYGSRARGDNGPGSDIDIAVYYKDGYGERENADFAMEVMYEIPTLYSFDVVCVNERTNKALLKNIIEDGVVLYMKTGKIWQFKRAFEKLKEASAVYEREKSELIRDALIQRFEFTFELSWLSMKECLLDEGIRVDRTSPKSIFKQAFAAGFINDERYGDMIIDRNKSTHTYYEELAIEISERIQNVYIGLFNNLLTFIDNREEAK
jgi:nucleotidyltransferase substrate binding protein (TIGR01987 family)